MGDLVDVGIGALRDVGGAGAIAGPLVVLLMIVLVYREVIFWPREIKDRIAPLLNEIAKQEAEIQRCHEAHDKTRDALLAEVGKGGETLVLVKEQLRAMETHRSAVEVSMRTVADRLQDLGRRRA